jgi:hypothetical protein
MEIEDCEKIIRDFINREDFEKCDLFDIPQSFVEASEILGFDRTDEIIKECLDG